MSTNTANYNLVKPSGAPGGDLVDIAVINANMDTIDTQIKNRSNEVVALQGVNTANQAAWASWTPTLTGITLGNGTVVAKFLQIGKTVQFRFEFTMGSTSVISGNPPSFSLPVPSIILRWRFNGETLDTGVANYPLMGRMVPANNTDVQMVLLDRTNGKDALVNNVTPYGFGTGDIITFNGTYEAA